MKKIIVLLFFATIAMNTSVVFAKETENKETTTSTTTLAKEKKLSKAEVKLLVTRLKEIRKMDKSDMTVEQKQDLKKEVLGIKEQLKKQNGVTIYLSGAAIIIILLLIILL